MRKSNLLLTGIGLGAVSAYLFDPDRGKERRERIREGCESASRKIGERARRTRHEISRRAREARSRVGSLLGKDGVETAPRDPEVEARRIEDEQGANGGEWSPAARVAAGSGGALAATWAVGARAAAPILVGVAGLALLARSVANRPLSELAAESGSETEAH